MNTRRDHAPSTPTRKPATDIGPTRAGADRRYLAPGWFTRHVVNPTVVGLVRLGVPVRGARELHVRGRTTGEWRAVPVNPLRLEDRTYLVAPRGRTQWVRNLRSAGTGRLRRGRRFDEFTAVELADLDRPPVIRAYLEAWAFEVGNFFDGVTADSSDDELLAVAPDFPVFELRPA